MCGVEGLGEINLFFFFFVRYIETRRKHLSITPENNTVLYASCILIIFFLIPSHFPTFALICFTWWSLKAQVTEEGGSQYFFRCFCLKTAALPITPEGDWLRTAQGPITLTQHRQLHTQGKCTELRMRTSC